MQIQTEGEESSRLRVLEIVVTRLWAAWNIMYAISSASCRASATSNMLESV